MSDGKSNINFGYPALTADENVIAEYLSERAPTKLFIAAKRRHPKEQHAKIS